MSRAIGAISLSVIALGAATAVHVPTLDAAGPRGAGQQAVAAQTERALLDQYCVTCHNERVKTAGLMLDKVDLEQVSANAEVLEKVVRKLRSGQMPPEGQPRPDKATLARVATALETALDRAAAATPNPGTVLSHRLNRAEYVNVIRDLLGLEIDGADLLPSDMAGFGFDNNADVLSITPGLMARYMAAATKISRLAVASLENRPIIQAYRPPPFARQTARMGEDLPFATHGGLAVRHAFPLDGDYAFKLRLQRSGTGATILGQLAENAYEIELRVDHALIKRFKIGGQFKGKVRQADTAGIAVPEDDELGRQIEYYRLTADKDLEVRLPIKAGTRLVAAAFVDVTPSAFEGLLTPVPSLKNGTSNEPGIDSLEIAGPYHATKPEETPSRRQIFTCRPVKPVDEEPCARKIFSTLARRAYRRPVSDVEVQHLIAVYKTGRTAADFETGIERGLEALLSMPKFLLRAEREPAGTRPGATYRVSDLELASRLSFFLWKSIPDDELMDLAARGKLSNPPVLEQQVRRMLADQRSTRWITDFMDQWLQIRNANTVEPDPALFPDFDDTLRDAIVRETELFVESQVRDDRSVLDLLRADYTFLNERLAEHYKVPNVYGSQFRRVAVTDPARQGLLGHASVLTVTSYANRTSVVLRGKWVLETLLGSPPPPPPPNVPPLKENDPKSKPASLRERMERHRRSAVCASCHSRMDPLGFALEHFDAIGRWRETDGGAEINSTITLDGRTVDSPNAFREAILSRGDEFLRTVTEKLLTYALARGVQYYDAPTVRQIMRETSRDNYRWSSLIVNIVMSRPFQMRKMPEADRSPAIVAGVAPQR